ncbi:MAG: glycerophosphodiester phosphodiesterase [bacterium]
MTASNAERKRKNWILIAAVLVIMLMGTLSGQPERLPTPYFDVARPMVIAHQGGNLLRPGNTLMAFDHAMSLGVDVLEMDVHLSADNQLVVIHDATVERTTNGQGAVNDLTLAELQLLDAGYHWPFTGTQRPYRSQGVFIPAFTQVLDRYPGQRLVVELKEDNPALAEALCDALVGSEREGLTLVASFHKNAMNHFRSVCPATATSASSDEVRWYVIASTLYLDRLFRAPALALQVPKERDGRLLLSQDFLKKASAVNLHVDYWTLNSLSDLRNAITSGAHGVITDRPDLMLDELGRL